ncbi:MAG TPA: NrfD/PsrC family molybdoenzyme membrane anchor subunit [Streptosporangiaceae bacterium]|nr:NrfD/PsrC family molybdoenzyme membrane anchor subunit [Streptosporangiaceae bacterium]
MTEQPQVPPAQFQSYYGRPILKVTRWREPHLPAYLFLGELSGATAVLGALAAATGRPRLARAGRLFAATAAYAGAGFLTAELGRPERFANMLRVAKPTSPMSMGSWILAAHSGLVTAAAASEVTGRLGRTGAVAGAAAALTGPLLATYPGVLLANTAVPAWHSGYRELPLLFAGGALTSAGAAGLAAVALGSSPAESGPAQRLALVGAAVESVAGFGLEHGLGVAGEPYREGDGGRLLRAARAMTLTGAVAAVAARRSRTAAATAAALLVGGGLCAKFAVLRAGVNSAADPKYVLATQAGQATGPAGRS